MDTALPEYLTLPDGSRLAFHATPARRRDDSEPGIVFLGGFMSDMTGDKATTLEHRAQQTGHAFLRLDYSGHGASDGDFADGTIGRWIDDARQVVTHCADCVPGLGGRLVLVGSSMGAWIMVRLAQQLLEKPDAPEPVGLVGIAAAPDFTEDLLSARLGPEAMATIAREGKLEMPSEYSDKPYIVTRRLIEEARDQLVLRRPIELDIPVRLLHGTADPDVPWTQSQKLLESLVGDDATLTLVKDGDHRLSTPRDLARLVRTVESLCAEIAGRGSAGVE